MEDKSDFSPPSWIDNEFIQKALRAGDGDSTITVVSSEVRMANAVGDGYVSDMYRATAQLSDGTSRSVIVKCHPQSGVREEMVKVWGAFKTELRMLSETIPAMSKLLEDASPGKYPPFSARCLYHGDEPVTFLVLEDLRQLGFTLAERQQGVDLQHCSLVMKTIARFHAASIVLHQKNPSAIECYDKSFFCEQMKEPTEKFAQGAFRAVANEVETWPEFGEVYSNKLRKLADNIFSIMADVLKLKKEAFNSLNHYDLWTSNIMFKYVDGEVVDMRLVDFQTAYYTSPAIDIHYFLSACPNATVMFERRDHLLQEYLSELNGTLEKLKCSKQLSMSGLEKELDEREMFAVFTSFMVLPTVLSAPEDGFNIDDSLEKDFLELNSTKTKYSGKTYKYVLEKLLPIYERKGLLNHEF